MLFKKKNAFVRLKQLFLDKTSSQVDETGSKRAIHALNITQLLGVVNDNVFKFLVVFYFIHHLGTSSASTVLFLAGIIYVLPFLFFSASAGVLADRHSKQRMIIALKFSELAVTLLALIAFYYQIGWAVYSLLFLISMQSAFFGPPKYSIIPELTDKDGISKANGLITASTYLAIIIGTFLASFLTQITNKNFALAALGCVVIAIIGLLASFALPYTTPQKHHKKVSPLFIREIIHTMQSCRHIPLIWAAIFGSAAFLYIGAYFQLNIIPFSLESLGLDEVYGGYLFLITAIGIALGAFVAGRLSKGRVELSISCLGGLGIAFFLSILPLSAVSYYFLIPVLIMVGFSAGFFVIPFDAYIQLSSPIKERGKIVAAANFLSFVGVALAPLTIFFFGHVAQLSSAQGFSWVALFFLVIALYLLKRLSHHLFHFISKTFVKPLYMTKVKDLPEIGKSLDMLILPTFNRLYTYLLAADHPEIRFYVPKKKRSFLDPLLGLFSPVHHIYSQEDKPFIFKAFIEKAHSDKEKGKTACLLFPNLSFFESKEFSHLLSKDKTFRYAKITHSVIKDPWERRWWKKEEVHIDFSKELDEIL